ncbi:hypothetical protein [Actinoplanes sp. NPDC051859]|uniref:hypothetical protein n=1 Tax=Actinoplanes sp. NPDC051859 TaxID=3363909 RepID=UPI0037A35319
MDLVKVGQLALLMVSPTLIVGAALYTPRVVRALWQLARPAPHPPLPATPPIEQLARQLRRLMHQHDDLRTSTRPGPRSVRLHALESAITDLAVAAATALDVPMVAAVPAASLPPAELRRLLHDLIDAGLSLPTVGLLAGDRPR